MRPTLVQLLPALLLAACGRASPAVDAGDDTSGDAITETAAAEPFAAVCGLSMIDSFETDGQLAAWRSATSTGRYVASASRSTASISTTQEPSQSITCASSG